MQLSNNQETVITKESKANDHVQAWDACLAIIRDNVHEKSYQTWFAPVKPKKLEDNVLTITVPSAFFYEYLEEHYIDLLSKAIWRVLGRQAKLEYNVIMHKDMAKGNGKPQQGDHSMNLPASEPVVPNKASNAGNGKREAGAPTRNPFIIPGVPKEKIDSRLHPNFTFSNFVEGQCNNLARTAGMAIAKDPGSTAFNPLTLYGKAGMGKTHLIQAIGLEAKERFPNKNILYVTTDRFIEQYSQSARNRATNDFVHYYQMIDVLILDDIQYFKYTKSTQNVFFHIFNHLHQLGKQLILTSDVMPSRLENIEDRLLSRFKWGLTAELAEPDYETRRNIILKKLQKDGTVFMDEIVDYLAENIRSTVREIEGAIIGLIANSTLLHKDITLDMARDVVEKLVHIPKEEITIDDIKKQVSDYTHVSEEELISRSRKRHIVQARQFAMYFAKRFTDASLSTIGAEIGNKDHATVLHSFRTVNNLIETDKNIKGQVAELEKLIHR